MNALYKIRFTLLFLHQIKDTAQSVLSFGGYNSGQHTARFAAQGAQVCKANLMSRIKAFASIFYLYPYPLSDRRLSYERMIPLSPPQANKIEPGFVCFFFYRPKANHGLPFLLTNKHSLPFPFSIPPKFTCLSAGKREHMTEKGKYLYYLYGKLNEQKKNPCFSVF